MRIGIVTQPLIANYGGTLQNFALQQVLKKLGHTPITIDFIPAPVSHFRYLCFLCKNLILYFIPGRKSNFHKRHIPKRNAVMDVFVKQHISTTRQVSEYNLKLIKEYDINAIVVGSDQVWRPMYNNFYNHNIEDMFLRFAKNANIKKIAYAASFGVDFWEFSKAQTKKCKQLAQQLDAVSVREASGIDLCKQHLNIDAVEMLDPTLLLDADDYKQVCKTIPTPEKPFLLSYVLDMNPEKEAFIRNIASKKGLEVKIFGADANMTLSIEEWLAMYRDADFVVTDSFHGTVFSIIFNKPFISIGNKYRGLSRFQSLLGKFNLSDRLVLEDSLEIDTTAEINWQKVNQLRDEWKEKSHNFITEDLNN